MIREYTERERAHMTNESYGRYYNSPSKQSSGVISAVSFVALGLLMLLCAIGKCYGVI